MLHSRRYYYVANSRARRGDFIIGRFGGGRETYKILQPRSLRAAETWLYTTVGLFD